MLGCGVGEFGKDFEMKTAVLTKKCCKVLNPFIWMINVARYFNHLEVYRGFPYEPYDFSKDLRYF